MVDIAKLAQRGLRHFAARLKNSCEQEIKTINQRLLTAKIQVQRLLRGSAIFNGRGHLAENIDIGAAKTVDGLFAISHNKQIGAAYQRQPGQQITLQTIGVLKFVYQKKLITFSTATYDLWQL